MSLKRRVARIQQRLDPLHGRDISELSDEELEALAGDIDPAFDAWLAQLNDADLEYLANTPMTATEMADFMHNHGWNGDCYEQRNEGI